MPEPERERSEPSQKSLIQRLREAAVMAATNQPRAAASALSSIPGLRMGTMASKGQVPEASLRASEAGDALGKSLLARYPQLSDEGKRAELAMAALKDKTAGHAAGAPRITLEGVSFPESLPNNEDLQDAQLASYQQDRDTMANAGQKAEFADLRKRLAVQALTKK